MPSKHMIYIDRLNWCLETSSTEVPEQLEQSGVTLEKWAKFVSEFNEVLAQNGKNVFMVIGSFLPFALFTVLSYVIPTGVTPLARRGSALLFSAMFPITLFVLF